MNDQVLSTDGAPLLTELSPAQRRQLQLCAEPLFLGRHCFGGFTLVILVIG